VSVHADLGEERGAPAPFFDPVRPVGAAALLGLVGMLAFLAAGSVAARQQAAPSAALSAPSAPTAATPDWMLDGYGATSTCHPAAGATSTEAAG
jgi:hypothetical protein